MGDFPVGTPVHATQAVIDFDNTGTFVQMYVRYQCIGNATGQVLREGTITLNPNAAQKTALAAYAAQALAQAKINEGV